MHKIAERLTRVQNRVRAATLAAGRQPAEVSLLAVSKRQPHESLAAAYAAGQRDFGESYVSEALAKMAALPQTDIQWHFIGPIQSNKTRAIAERFAWVHSLDRLKIAERLNRQRPSDLPPLQVCLQVNIDQETSKAGCHPDELPALAQAIATLPALHLRGLMTIPQPGNGAAAFARVAALQQQLNATADFRLDTLSMGMSADLEIAIAAGATVVRVGTDIFGERQ